jgi:type IV fimbrial biogenesis protein FimT
MMKLRPSRTGSKGFTLIELMIAVAVVAIIIMIAAPSFRDMVLMQRLRAINAQVVTDMQFARNEAVSRATFVRVSFQEPANGLSCYSIYTSPSATNSADQQCNCLLGAGAACPKGSTELRTVQVPASQSVTVFVPPLQAYDFAFDPSTGGIYSIPADDVSEPMDRFVVSTYIDNARKLSTVINRTGRPLVCTPSGSTMREPACAP